MGKENGRPDIRDGYTECHACGREVRLGWHCRCEEEQEWRDEQRRLIEDYVEEKQR